MIRLRSKQQHAVLVAASREELLGEIVRFANIAWPVPEHGRDDIASRLWIAVGQALRFPPI